MRDFAYECPETVADAVAVLWGAGARPLAGGTDLIPQMREGRRSVDRVVDLKRIPELVAIRRTPDDGWLAIGAAASATRVARDKDVAGAYPGLADAARLIGSRQIQNRASLGGNICNAAPSADLAPPLICLGARARIAGPGAERQLDVEKMFDGPGRTVLAPGEILVSILLPPPSSRAALTYLRFTPRREMDIAVAGAAAWIRLDKDGRIGAARVALASVAPTPVRAPSAERVLLGAAPSPALFQEAGRAAAGDTRPISDTRGSAEYRRELVKVLTARALGSCRDKLLAEAA